MILGTKICFTNPAKLDVLHNDETEFDTTREEDLAELWWIFCKENDLIDVRRCVIEPYVPDPFEELDPYSRKALCELTDLCGRANALGRGDRAHTVMLESIKAMKEVARGGEE